MSLTRLSKFESGIRGALGFGGTVHEWNHE